MAQNPRIREISKLVPGQSRLRGRSRRHPSLATDAQAWARAVWTPCLPQPRPAMPEDAANLRLAVSSVGRLGHARFQCTPFAALPASLPGSVFAPSALRLAIAKAWASAGLRAALALDDLDRDHAAEG